MARELSWSPKSSSKTILATARYEIITGLCKRVWHKNFIKMPACRSVRVGLTKPNSPRRTWPSIRSILYRKSTTIISFTVVQRKTKRFTSTCTKIIMTLSPRCPDSSLAATIATPARKPTVIAKNTCVRTSASVAEFLPFVLKSPG